MSALGHKQTHAAQQFGQLLDHLVGAGQQRLEGWRGRAMAVIQVLTSTSVSGAVLVNTPTLACCPFGPVVLRGLLRFIKRIAPTFKRYPILCQYETLSGHSRHVRSRLELAPAGSRFRCMEMRLWALLVCAVFCIGATPRHTHHEPNPQIRSPRTRSIGRTS
jgi:hypothetical protein